MIKRSPIEPIDAVISMNWVLSFKGIIACLEQSTNKSSRVNSSIFDCHCT